MSEIKTLMLGAGYVTTFFAVGLERLKKGEIEPYGVPLADFDMGVDINDIKIIACIDVDARKVGRTMYDVARKFYRFKHVPQTLKDIVIHPGIEMGFVKELFPIASLDYEADFQNSVEEMYGFIERCKPDVIVDATTTQYAEPFHDYMMLEKAVRDRRLTPGQLYAYLALKLMEEGREVSYVNVIPTPIANDYAYVSTAEKFGGLVLGDDGATGATPLTADLLEHLKERNRRVLGVVQLNIGGNDDFKSLLEEKRNKAKEYTKSSIIEDILGYYTPSYIKPTGFLSSLGDKKFVSIHIEYNSFNRVKDEIIVNMRINDSPALAGYIVDLVRLSKLALKAGFRGTVYEINAFYMKKPGPPNAKNTARIIAFERLVSFLKTITDKTTLNITQKAC
ncbi:MAG: myo-inositol-1-phosphate synthase [Candidatus Bathyarchaeia archaeon]